MVIEWLRFRVADAEFREEFVRIDGRVWTEALGRYPGFIGKEVWLDPDASDTVAFIIRWRSRTQWKAIPTRELDLIQEQFDAEVGDREYALLESKEFQVRKFCNRGEQN